jgi:hypothetical protein
MDTWPITLITDRDRAVIGIPDRLGTGRLYQPGDSFPTLEEIAGEDWSAEVLGELLPTDRAWAWWTRTEMVRLSGLSGGRAAAAINHRTLDHVVTHRLLLKGMTLAVVPAGHGREQNVVREYADVDTEQVPDHIWTSPDEPDTWQIDEIVAWCDDPAQWTDRASAARQPAERIVAMFDNQISCALATVGAQAAMARLETLARRWRLRLIAGPAEYAWPVER